MKVEVAVLMQPFGAFRVPPSVVAKSDWDLAWDERAVASFEVDSSVTIGSILNTGAAALDVTVDDYEGEPVLPSQEVAGVAFFVDDEEQGRSKGTRVYPTVDDSGVARWDEDIMSVPLARALAAAKAGLIVGDPRRLYLVPQSSAGAFDGLDWGHALDYLKIAEGVVARIGADVAGVVAVAASFRTTWKVARKALERGSSQWRKRGGGLFDVGEVAGHERRVEDVARLLNCSEDDAAALVEFFRAKPGSPDEGPDAGALVSALRRSVDVLAVAGFEFLPNGEREADRVLDQIARDVIAGREPTDDEVRTLIYRVVNPHYGEWDG